MSQQATEQVVTQGQPTGDNSQGAGTGQQQQQQTQGQQQQQQNNQPPYADYLNKFPESVRGIADPIFKEWDGNVTRQFQQLHSQYEWAKPWQEFAQNYDPETASQGVQLLQALSENPQQVYEAIANAYGFTTQGQNGNGQQPTNGEQGQQPNYGDNEFQDPRVDQLMETVNTLAEILTNQHQQTQEQQQEQEFFNYLDGLRQQHGEFDGNYVLAQIAAGVDPEQAVQDGVRIHQALNGNGQPTPPVVMGGGGGVPSNSVEPNKLDRRGTQELIAGVLSAQLGQAQQ